jgi:hypothetical protein
VEIFVPLVEITITKPPLKEAQILLTLIKISRSGDGGCSGDIF